MAIGVATHASQLANDGGDARRSPGSFGAQDLALFAIVVLTWSTAWYALKLQLGVVPPMQSLTWRFLVATLAMLAIARWQKESLRFSLADHGLLFATGMFLYAGCFGLFYYGSFDLPSGLVSVIFSLASLINLVLGRLLFGEKMAGSVLVGALVGVAGVGALFAPLFMEGFGGRGALFGITINLVATVMFCVGNLASTRLFQRRPAVAALNTWAMGYGTLCFAAAALLQGEPLVVDYSPAFVGSFLWLTIMATVVSYWAYTRLSGRVGAARAGYAAVTSPLIALVISTIFEGYEWSAPAVAGVVLVSIGNVLVLRR